MPENTPATGPDTAAETAQGTDWKALARKWETRSKENAGAAAERDAIAAERDALKAELEAAQTANLTEAEKTAKAIADLEAKFTAAEAARQTAELDALRTRIGSDKGLPAALIARLNGSTEEEITADAESLLAAVGPAAISTGQGNLGHELPGTTNPLAAALAGKVGGQL